jgi:DNA-binding MarR family transcriptional regulator
VVAEPRWLDDEQQHAWRRLAAVVLKLPGALESQLQRDSDLSHFEYWVLALLSEAPDRTLRLSDLAGQANASLSRLSHVVTRLERRGWVARRPCPDDARATLGVLTDEGAAQVEAAAPGHVETVRGLVFEALDARGVRDLARLCELILERIDASPQRRAKATGCSIRPPVAGWADGTHDRMVDHRRRRRPGAGALLRAAARLAASVRGRRRGCRARAPRRARVGRTRPPLLGWEVVERDATGARLADAAGTAVPLDLLLVPDERLTKNRVHPDLIPSGEEGDRESQQREVERALSLGARRVDIGQGDARWEVLVDTEGNELCILGPRGWVPA